MKKMRLFSTLFVFLFFIISLQSIYIDANESPRGQNKRLLQDKSKPRHRFDRFRKHREEYLKMEELRMKTTASSSNVELLGSWPYGACWVSAIDASRNIAIIGNGEVLQILDISTPSSPLKIGEINLFNEPLDIAISGDYAYVGAGWWYPSVLYVIDISDLTNPNIVGSTTVDGYGYSLEVSNNHVYIASENNGLKIFDVSSPTNPFEVGTYSADGNYVRDVALWGNYACIINNYFDDPDWVGQMRVIDITTPSNPGLVGTYRGEPYVSFNGIDTSPAGYAHVVQYYWDDSSSSDIGKLIILDITTDPSNPTEVGSRLESFSSFEDIVVSGVYAYIYEYLNDDLIITDFRGILTVIGI